MKVNVLMSAMLISTLNLPHTHSGNALVSCICDAVDRLLIGVGVLREVSCVYFFLVLAMDGITTAFREVVSKDQELGCMYCLGFYDYLLIFSIIIACNAILKCFAKLWRYPTLFDFL